MLQLSEFMPIGKTDLVLKIKKEKEKRGKKEGEDTSSVGYQTVQPIKPNPSKIDGPHKC